MPTFSRDLLDDCGYLFLRTVVGVVTALEIQKRNKERVNVYLDGEYAFSLALIDAAQLRKGQTLTRPEIEALRDEDAIKRAIDSAARFLAHRPRSIAEVRGNLSRKNFPDTVIDTALNRLEAMGYLDDVAFTRYWLENRSTFKPRGPMALRYELRQKGVSSAIIDAALEDVDVQDAAYRAARQKVSRYTGLTRRQCRDKLGGFLQRRGFDFATCRDVIEQIVSELDIETPTFFAEDHEEQDDWSH